MRKLLALALLTLPFSAAARADSLYDYRCRGDARSPAINARLRFELGARSGRLELEVWAGYPPEALVYAPLSLTAYRANGLRYQSGLDANTGLSASVRLPENFRRQASFAAHIQVEGSRPGSYELSCEPF